MPATLERYPLITELAQLSDAAARRGMLRRNRRLHSPEVVDFLYEEVVRLARVDLRQADRLAQAAAWIAERLEDDYCRAQGLRAAGHVLLIRGKYAEAVQSYRSALALFRRLGRDEEVGRTLYGGSLQALIYLGKYDEAFSWALEAREIFQRLGDELRLARLDNNMGNILYRQDRFEAALECYRRAFESFGRKGEAQDVAITLRNMAVCHISLGDSGKAMETYQEARAHCERNEMPLMVAEADYNIAYLHYQRGEYTRAVDLYQSTRKHCEKFGDPYHKALCDLDQSEMYLELNLDEEGAQLAEKAASSFRELTMRYEEAKALTFLAVAASHRGRGSRALQLFGQARSLFARERNQVWVALIDLYKAVVLYKTGCYEKARLLCASALAFFSKSSLESKAALCELLRARLYLQALEYEKAQDACLDALKRVGEVEAPIISCQAHFVLGQVRELQLDRKGATRAYEKAHALLESLRSHLKGEELKIAFLKDKLAVYESLVWMCLGGERGSQRKKAAFAYIEQAKSRSLADLIAFKSLDVPAHTGPQGRLTARARKLRTTLNLLYRQIELVETDPRDHAGSRLESLRRAVAACEDRLVKVLAELRGADRQFGVLENAHTIELEAIRSIIPQDSVLLEYYQARETVYACVLARNALEIVPVTTLNKIRNLLRLLQFQLSKFRLGPDYVNRFAGALQSATSAHLKDLYNELIAPVRHLLRAEHLVVVPHDFLHYLPFHALHDGRSFLIDSFSVSYAPSASVYYLCCSKPAASSDESLILGIPDSFTPHILEEVKQIASMLPNPRLFVGDDATENRLRAHGPGSRFVHIATHGLFRQDNPMFSAMRLGDSQLSLLDLYSLQLSSELVTLSGCSTGLNAVVGGDELLGLVRGLLYAGTRAVLVTLWDVDDRSTAEFMKAFYGHLVSGSDKARSLQLAMREVREIYSHPFYWSPFVLIGKT
ncbi:MAG TPA: CHAT domain-containing protein [Acidobacteriota bacterium]|nr:CHAT domain-containing protein [Acidobacteriota bacterium]